MIRSITFTILTAVVLSFLNGLNGCKPDQSEKASAGQSHFDDFITRSGNKLMEGDEKYRFISFNIPNLNFVEDEMAFGREHAFRLPDSYEIRDALVSVKQMGGRVARMYTFPVRREGDSESLPRYVTGPGEFNEIAFRTMDTVLAIANEVGVRIIVPFINNWKWMGGRPQYAHFRGKTQEEFWTDPQLIEDVKKTIDYVINRKNTVTGVRYKDDKAIMCWETGNELTSEYSWTKQIVKYIQELDTNHLLMHGYHAVDNHLIKEEVITDPNIDIVTSHHYEIDPRNTLKNIDANRALVDGRKPYLVGEFGFQGPSAIEQVLDKVIAEDIVGALIWSLRYHRREGGFYWHSEPLGMGVYKSYHWPGFDSGDEYGERELLDMYRAKAFEIQNKTAPERQAPNAPKLLPIEDVTDISWQGSTGAASYDVQRSENKKGPWETVGLNVSDARLQYTPLFYDCTAEMGESYYYRVIARNVAGISSASNVVGPVKVETQALVDHLKDLSAVYFSRGELSIATDNDRKFKEDMYRLKGQPGSEIVYYVPGHISGFHIYAFSKANEDVMSFSVSSNGNEFEEVSYNSRDFFTGEGDYDYWIPLIFKHEELPEQAKYLKISFRKEAQLSRVEVFYQ